MSDAERAYVFTATVQFPDDTTITVTTTVPSGHVGFADRRLTSDISEVTSANASRAAGAVADVFKANDERNPF